MYTVSRKYLVQETAMENLIIAFNAVLPVMLCIMLGYFLARIGMIKEELRKGLNSLCFKVLRLFFDFQWIIY